MSWLFLAAQQADPASAVQPALSTLDKTVIGALLVVSWAIVAVLLSKLLKQQDKVSEVQNLRVQDLNRMNERMEAITERLITTFAKMESALTNMTQAEKDGQMLLQAMKNSQETVILEAVRGRHQSGGK